MDYAQIEKLTEKVKAENDFVAKIKSEIGDGDRRPEALIDRILISYMSSGHVLLRDCRAWPRPFAIRAFFPGDRHLLPEGAVHAGPPPRRPDRDEDLQPEGDGLLHQEGAHLHEPAPSRRDQPRACEGSVGPPPVHGGKAGHHRRGDLFSREAFHGAGDREPIEQEGTYPLPEAQLDRFFMRCWWIIPRTRRRRRY